MTGIGGSPGKASSSNGGHSADAARAASTGRVERMRPARRSGTQAGNEDAVAVGCPAEFLRCHAYDGGIARLATSSPRDLASSGGKSRTNTQTGVDEKGQQINNVYVWENQ